MNEKFLHITSGLNEPYPSPGIPEDLAWEDMRKLLDEEDKKLSAPPPLFTPPSGNNSNWKYGLLLLFITGIFCFVNWDKLRQVYNRTQSENAYYKKENNQNKTGERNFRVNDSINNPASNNHAVPAISSQPTNNAKPVVVESDSPHLSTKTGRITRKPLLITVKRLQKATSIQPLKTNPLVISEIKIRIQVN